MEFLGYLVGNGSMTIPEKRVEAFNRPTTKRGLRSFLGAILLPKICRTAGFGHSNLFPCNIKAGSLESEAMESAFHNIYKCIANSCVLTIPHPEDAMSVVTDASGLEIGGVLQVWRGQDWEVAAFSRQTRSAEQHYSATELEAQAQVETIKHFRYYLYGKEFLAFTDHKPLCQLLSSDCLNGRLRRLGMKLQHWLVEIC